MPTDSATEKDYQEWIRKANDDFISLQSLARHRDATPSTGCFLAQQIVEKVLKALIAFHNLEIEKTHDLIKLSNTLEPAEPEITKFIEELATLNRYYVETRYPGEFPEFSWHECQQALEFTEKIRSFVLDKVKQ